MHLKENRKLLPPGVVSKKLDNGEIYELENENGVVIQKWKPNRKKPILLLPTKHNLDMKDTRRTEIGFSESQVSMSSKTDCVSEDKRKIKAKSVIEYYSGKTGIDTHHKHKLTLVV